MKLLQKPCTKLFRGIMNKKYVNLLIKMRRDLHKIAEIGFKEEKTKKYIKRYAEKLSCKTIEAGGGIILFFDLHRADTYAFRAELDALNIMEKTKAPYKSTTPYMHACGHDGHMAMCLCLAVYINDCLKQNIDSFLCNIAIVFQPAEELAGGASSVINSGVLQKLNLSAFFALHLMPQYEFGKIFSNGNVLMAGSNEVDVLFFGETKHIAKNDLSGDVLDAVTAFHQEVMTNNKRTTKGFMRFGILEGGTVRNVSSDKACLKGTMRFFNETTQNNITSFALDCAKQISAKTGVEISVNINESEGNPPVKNEATLFRKIKNNIQIQTTDALFLCDDFSFYNSLCPSLYSFLGIGNTHSLHSPFFDFDDSVLESGLQFFIDVLKIKAFRGRRVLPDTH